VCVCVGLYLEGHLYAVDGGGFGPWGGVASGARDAGDVRDAPLHDCGGNRWRGFKTHKTNRRGFSNIDGGG
jgi:hypothetical protein